MVSAIFLVDQTRQLDSDQFLIRKLKLMWNVWLLLISEIIGSPKIMNVLKCSKFVDSESAL